MLLVCPPSTTTQAPVMNAARSEDRKTIRSAISLGPTKSAQRHFGVDLLQDLVSSLCQVRLPRAAGEQDVPWGDRVHSHVGRPQLASEVLAVADQRGLGSAIWQGRGRALEANDRRDEDDAASASDGHQLEGPAVPSDRCSPGSPRSGGATRPRQGPSRSVPDRSPHWRRGSPVGPTVRRRTPRSS